jgi:hypothetical protein
MGIMTSEARTAFGLTTLLAPVLPDDFFRHHWERKPLHLSRGDAHYYDSVLTNQDLEFIISSTDLRYPAIQLARNGAYLAPEAYTKNVKHGSEFFNGVPDIAQIQSEYRSGSTVVLPAMQRTWAPLRELCEGWRTISAIPFMPMPISRHAILPGLLPIMIRTKCSCYRWLAPNAGACSSRR